MKLNIFLLILFSVCTISYTGDNATEHILCFRTDQNDVTSIKSINYPKDLDDTTLKSILTQAYNLETLVAQNNLLHQPRPQLCRDLSTIDFSNGKIKNFILGEWIDAMPKLRILNLAHNKISSIASDFDTERSTCGPCGTKIIPSWSSSTLQEIDLSHNELTEFDLHIVDNATNLVKADFSHNKITTVVIPKALRRRKVCKVYLHNNQLRDADKSALEKCNILNTQEYEDSLESHKHVGTITGAVTGIGSTIGMIFSIQLSVHPVAAAAIGVVNCCAQIGAGYLLGYGVKKCRAYDTVHTYQPFIFNFENQKNNDQVAIQLEQFQEEQ